MGYGDIMFSIVGDIMFSIVMFIILCFLAFNVAVILMYYYIRLLAKLFDWIDKRSK